MTRLPTSQGEKSFMSVITLDVLAEVDHLGQGRPVAPGDLWGVIQHRRELLGAQVLSATLD